MKNKITNLKNVILAGAFFLALNAFGQSSGAPEKMSYQAVVRNTTNNLVTNQAVGMRVSILQGSITGTAVFIETQTPTANANGLVSFEIGGGNPVTGTFAAIDWANGPYFVKTETDPTGGTNYTIVGVSQLLSTPYALYAKNSGSSTPGPQGIAGPQGSAGMNGLDGATGPMGPQGPQGPAGEQGIAGPQGPAGMNGLDGATGPMGPQGPAGIDGTNGLDGATGPMGPQGIQGLTGPAGATGANGTNGVDGTNGLDGATGPMGPQGPAGTPGANGQGVPVGGTTGQVLAKVNETDFNTQWVTPSAGGSGAQVALIATKTSNAQVLPLANGTNTGDLVTFNNIVIYSNYGGYNPATNTFTVYQDGVYYIQATVRTPDAPTANQTVNPFLFVDVDNAGITGLNNIITDYQVANPTNFPLGAKGKGFTSVMLYLTGGQTINIKGLSANSGTLSQGLSTNGSCKFMIFKL